MSMQATALESQNQTREGPGVKPAAIRTTGCADKEREKKVTPEGSHGSHFCAFIDGL